jgi:hypothetical protein
MACGYSCSSSCYGLTDVELGQCKFDTPGFRDFHRRAQLFILLYIEAGSYIQASHAQFLINKDY